MVRDSQQNRGRKPVKTCRAESSRLVRDAAESDVVHAGVDHLRLACRRTITQAIVGRAQVRAAFDNLARNSELRLRGIVTLVG